MWRKIRILLWHIVSDWEQRLYPYENEDTNDYYYTVKNDETGENFMIIEWIKSFDERIIRLQDEMIYVQNEIRRMKNDSQSI
jgi:hypothetical protein